jgi:predicted TIM-barrel fold metal-dependent hydrolase
VARERGLPVQFHTGFGGGPRPGGGPGAEPHRTDPARLGPFVAALQPAGVPVILLNCYPFHRHAAYLAGLYPHVYVDVGLALPHTAAASARVMSELLELAPFHKQLFSSGCRGVAESCMLGALYFRRALGTVLAARVEAGEWSAPDAARIAHMIGSGNARRVYRL